MIIMKEDWFNKCPQDEYVMIKEEKLQSARINLKFCDRRSVTDDYQLFAKLII
jgi:hypothetical protein